MDQAIKISTMSGKLKGFKAINFSPLTAVFCQKMAKTKGTVCEYCYSRRMLKTYRKACNAPYASNAALLSIPLKDQELPRFAIGDMVRIAAHGEIDNKIQASNLLRMVSANQLTIFGWWTKRTDILPHAISRHIGQTKNLVLIQSSYTINKPDIKASGFDIVFTVYNDPSLVPEDAFICAGKKCSTCMHCYTPGVTQDVAEILRK